MSHIGSWSVLGYLFGLVLVVGGVLVPLAIMGLRSQSVFRRGTLKPPAPFQ